MIESGRAEVSVNDGEKSLMPATSGTNSVFAEMAVIAGGRRSATAVAREETRVIAMPLICIAGSAGSRL